MIALETARQYLETLGLTEAASVLDARLEIAAEKQMSYADFLAAWVNTPRRIYHTDAELDKHEEV